MVGQSFRNTAGHTACRLLAEHDRRKTCLYPGLMGHLGNLGQVVRRLFNDDVVAQRQPQTMVGMGEGARFLKPLVPVDLARLQRSLM